MSIASMGPDGQPKLSKEDEAMILELNSSKEEGIIGEKAGEAEQLISEEISKKEIITPLPGTISQNDSLVI